MFEDISFEPIRDEQALKEGVIEEYKREVARHALLLLADTIARCLVAEGHDVELQYVFSTSLIFTASPPASLTEIAVLARKEGFECDLMGDFLVVESDDYGTFEVAVEGEKVKIEASRLGRVYREEEKRIESMTFIRGDFEFYTRRSFVRLTNAIKIPRYAPRTAPIILVEKSKVRFYVDEKSAMQVKGYSMSLKVQFEGPCVVIFSL